MLLLLLLLLLLAALHVAVAVVSDMMCWAHNARCFRLK
jgi:hypothetical protein